MSKQHKCGDKRRHLHIRIDGTELTAMDEYTFDIDYCPYCGKTAEEIGNGTEQG